jgi:hypothetical protein
MDNVHESLNILMSAASNYKKPLIIKSLKQFGDVAHTSIIVHHYRKAQPKRQIIWAISSNYIDAFKYYKHATKIIGLPHDMSLDDRQRLTKKLKNVFEDMKSPCPGVGGWNTAGSIANQFLFNAKISKLLVPRRPIMPISDTDTIWADEFINKHSLGKRFVTLEYNSYSFKRVPDGPIWTLDMYSEFLKHMKLPVVWLAHNEAMPFKYGVDGRGTSWRQAAALIKKSSLFIGCGSGLTMVAATEGIDTPIIEIDIGNTITMTGCGYKRSIQVHHETPIGMIKHVNTNLRQS